MSKQKIIVVGNGMTSVKFCEKLIAKAGVGTYDIIVFGEEPRPAYDRVHLTDYYTGTAIEDLTMKPLDWYKDNQIKLHIGELITDVSKTKKVVTTHRGTEYAYDKLILSTGSSAFVPPINGVNKEGVFVYRTIEDLEAIKAYIPKCKKAAVMGGGLLGLEAAKAVLDDGLPTSIIEFAPRLMPRQLDDAGSKMLQGKLEQFGLEILLNKSTLEIAGDGKIEKMVFADDTSIDVDMLVISAGIKPRDELARAAGLDVGVRGGMQVDNYMQTTDKDIYAIGENALHGGMIYGMIAPCYDMAEVAVNHILQDDIKEFLGFDMSSKLKLIGTDVGSFGDPFVGEDKADIIVYENKKLGSYKRINISKDGKKLLGGILVGDASDYSILHQICINEMPVPENAEDLILGSRGGDGGSALGVGALPDTAVICSCENVSKGDIVSAFEGGAREVSEIKSCTAAGTGCGGCVPMLNDLLTECKKAAGEVVKKVICEHFQYSRQELFDLIKIKEIKSYNGLLDEVGEGDGCEICKPAVASLLATIWNEPILKQDTIQDSNDRFLANIQRGGSYSVVPRIAGGEVTPEKLIVLGQVAKKYNLYCKVTGGQRIDLFGAHLNDLPPIWEELIAAGFESGHAYGKSLRTVKSCVGSTWCRFGVQDSVGFAIDIENRYKGLRSPHKLKGAVSGCVRECAEAQNKDFGIIATDKGWNLYVGGNGGSKPQHGWLLAADVDTETCVKYIDRYLMFYVRTADQLTRTATWLNKLDGGIDYLKQVVIEDSLGICAELEAHMQHQLDTYVCEWKDAVENPEKRKRFSHFINSDEKSDTLGWGETRGQKMPLPW